MLRKPNTIELVSKKNINNLPGISGVYSFKNEGEVLYIGKAENLKERIKNHFSQPTFKDAQFIPKTTEIEYIETNSEIEALLLESELIKKFQPKYNTIWKDDKNYFYIQITKEKLPCISITHQKKDEIYIGPFVDGNSLKKTLKILRRVFPYYTKRHGKSFCMWCHLGLCPGPDTDIKKYRQEIRNLSDILKGRKQKVLRSLKKDMETLSKESKYEEAARARDRFLALGRTVENAKVFEESDNWNKTEKILQSILKTAGKIERIEGYDVSNIQGQNAVASMVVFHKGKPDKSSYRKFKIHISGKPNDTAMIKEVITRRINHKEWPSPDLVLIDGGKGQLNAALSDFKTMAIAKRNNELYVKGKNSPLLLKLLPREIYNLILQIRDESHRFAITFHKKLRKRDILDR